MRQVFLEKGAIQIKNVAEPLLDKNTVMVSVHYSCISPGTEQATISNAQESPLTQNLHTKITKVLQSFSNHGIEGTKALIREKLQGSLQALGYSCSGKIIAVGKNITRLRVGDFVACAGAGFANHASIVVVPENLVVRVSEESLLKDASITTLGAIALQGIRRAQIQLGETVCIIGLGLLGQLTVQLARQAGANIIGIDLLQERLSLAQKYGAETVINATEDLVKNTIDHATYHEGVDVTIITAASKSNAIMQQAMEITRKKGRVVLVGDVGLTLERSPFYQKEIDFLISCSYGPGRYDKSYEHDGIDYPYAYVRWTENRNMQAFVRLIEQKKIEVEPLISACFDVDEVEKAYQLLKEKNLLGALLCYKKYQIEAYDQDKKTQLPQMPYTSAISKDQKKIRIGVIGAGGFAKIKLMPIVSRLENLKIDAIVDANITTSLAISQLYKASRIFTDDQALFDENLVDAVIISSPHKYHCSQALKALQHNKAVFLEKPMVTDFEQLNTLYEYINTHQNIPFCVDYNRSFAPYIQKIKEELHKKKSPAIIFYRMNAGFIPADHWVQTEIGAGRIIGEACHIIDLFYYLTDSYVTSISVEAIKPLHNNLFTTDNFSAQLSFYDGSVCTLIYTSLGHSALGKERMEIYFDSKSIVMEDYKTLQGFGLSRSFNQTTKNPDKGHEALLKMFFSTLQASPYKPPIDHKRLKSVAHVTLIINQLASQGGGSQEFLAL